ncbi:MAG: bifunctional methylenetetrahydrofolate dehydrogenase/methenyltetrahydrofolate cyclohydrolase FolD [Alphaproteobacteria bacterium]|nr:bifunctional methylenetetrahydrofolate dehydrogenase/methenyltetrahydrofolate cyclohydrolase FolD [Alphaproteobacteria bacterium]
MTARRIDGTALASALRARVAAAAADLRARAGIVPGLAAVLVGADAASEVYVRSKGKAAEAAGLRSFTHRLAADAAPAALLDLVHRLVADEAVDGILVQLPLPRQFDASAVIAAIAPAKDVDGFHVVNAGLLVTGRSDQALVPATPQGCMMLLGSVHERLAGLDAVVVGRSNIVGKPVASLLLAADCTVTIAHSRTCDLETKCRNADILVAAVGRAGFVRGAWIKPGATVIDVGINRVAGADGRARLVGDVDHDEARAVAGAITPVPGGVGPMTIACLLRNTVIAACRRRGIAVPAVI